LNNSWLNFARFQYLWWLVGLLLLVITRQLFYAPFAMAMLSWWIFIIEIEKDQTDEDRNLKRYMARRNPDGSMREDYLRGQG
jgi:hypothetical protein